MQRVRRTGSALPPVAIAMAVVGLMLFFVLPLLGLLWRTPWRAIGDVLSDRDARSALRLSLVCSLAATGLSVLFGLPIAWLLARGRFRGRSALRALAILPLVIPPVVGGIALFYAFGRRGLIGQWLDRWFGVRLPFTMWAAIVAETFVAMPFLIITVEGALRGLDERFEDAAATLGASRWTVFRRVTLPMISPALAAGIALTWARALGEFGATITFAGSFPGKTQTAPLAIYLAYQNNQPAAIVLSLVLLLVSVGVLVGVGSRVLGARVPIGPASR